MAQFWCHFEADAFWKTEMKQPQLFQMLFQRRSQALLNLVIQCNKTLYRIFLLMQTLMLGTSQLTSILPAEKNMQKSSKLQIERDKKIETEKHEMRRRRMGTRKNQSDVDARTIWRMTNSLPA